MTPEALGLFADRWLDAVVRATVAAAPLLALAASLLLFAAGGCSLPLWRRKRRSVRNEELAQS